MTPPRFLAEAFWAVHRRVYRWSGGRIGKRWMGPGRDCLLLTTTGRKSGERRSTALLYLEDGDRLVVVASNLGSDRAPAWWLNLAANPEAEVALGTRRRRVRAREASDEERAALWPRLVDYYGGYDEYREGTDRRIPVVLLEPAPA